jgi:hypothetical protein
MILDLESFKNRLPLPIGNLTVTSKDFMVCKCTEKHWSQSNQFPCFCFSDI